MKESSADSTEPATTKPTAKKFQTVDEYIASLPPETQKVVKELRKTIKLAAPQAVESIGYNMPMYKWNGMLVGFAAWKQHIGVYPLTDAMETSIKALAPFKGDKHTLKFPLDTPLPLELITKVVKYRMKENRP